MKYILKKMITKKKIKCGGDDLHEPKYLRGKIFSLTDTFTIHLYIHIGYLENINQNLKVANLL